MFVLVRVGDKELYVPLKRRVVDFPGLGERQVWYARVGQRVIAQGFTKREVTGRVLARIASILL